MKQQYLIGIDLGSRFIKATIFDLAGASCGEAKSDNRPSQPKAGVAEYDGDGMVRGTLAAIRDLLAQCEADGTDVVGICMDGMISGTMGIDAKGDATTPYTTPLDMRFGPQLNRVMDRHHDMIRMKTGSGMAVIGPKIMWIREEFPDAYARTARFVTAVGYVVGKIAGLKPEEAFIDFTYLWTSGLSHTPECEWSSELCEALGVPVDRLPRIVQPTDIVGQVGATAAGVTGLRQGTPIVAGAGDQSAGFVGAGLTRPNRAADVAGTYPILAVCTDVFEPDLKHRAIEIFPSPIPGLYNPCSVINGGGLTHHWFQETFAGGESGKADGSTEDRLIYETLDAKAAKLPPGSEKLLFNPHLGGRVCPVQTNFKGAWLGFTWTHKKEHFYRAVLEGIAYDHAHALRLIRDLYPQLKIDEVRVYGGGSLSRLWNQIKSDVLSLPYVVLGREDLSALGDAIIAACALGIFDNMAEAAEKFVNRARRCEPDGAAHGTYRGYVDAYGKFLEATAPCFDELARL